MFFSLDDGAGASSQRHAYVFALGQKGDAKKITSGATDDDEVEDVSDDGKRLAIIRRKAGDVGTSPNIVLLDLESGAETIVTSCSQTLQLATCKDVRFDANGNLWFVEGTQTGTLHVVAPTAGAQASDRPFDLDSRCQIESIAMSADRKSIFVDVIDSIGLGCPEAQIGLFKASIDAKSLGTAFVVGGIAQENGGRIHRVVAAREGDRVFFLGTSPAGSMGAWSITYGGMDLLLEAETGGDDLAVSKTTVFTVGSQKSMSFVATNPIGGTSPTATDVMMDPRPETISSLVWSAR